MTAFNFPEIDPIILPIYGPIALRWYNLAYIVGIGGGLIYCKFLIKRFKELQLTAKHLDDFLFWALVAIIIGGRLGEVLFYPSESFWKNWQFLKLWDGGMSFHGATIGLFFAFYLFSKKYKISIYHLGDCVTAVAPIGLFFGRIANFVNDELYGRITSVPWAVKFPSGGYVPRHPSQLYEAFLEGALLFILLQTLIYKFQAFKKPGLISATFLLGYGFSRFFIEFFREPDGMFLFLTTGQALTLPLIFAGAYLLKYSMRR